MNNTQKATILTIIFLGSIGFGALFGCWSIN